MDEARETGQGYRLARTIFAGLKEKIFASCGALLSWLVVFILFSCAALKIVAT